MSLPEFPTNSPHSCLSSPPSSLHVPNPLVLDISQAHPLIPTSGLYPTTRETPIPTQHRHGSCCPLPFACSAELPRTSYLSICIAASTSRARTSNNLRASHRGDVYTYSVSDLSTEMICQEVSELPNDSPKKAESRPPFECNRATFLQAAPKGLPFCLCPSWPSSQPSIKVSSEMTGSAPKGTH